ncbi:hypothetical protein [Bartonella taylorii]|nr:hypothetical protein [Bartonella taylorii]
MSIAFYDSIKKLSIKKNLKSEIKGGLKGGRAMPEKVDERGR